MNQTEIKREIKTAAGKAYRQIANTEARTHDEHLSNGWRVRASRVYFHRPVRVAWSPRYDLVAPNGRTPVAGYHNAADFAAYIARRGDLFSCPQFAVTSYEDNSAGSFKNEDQ